jgi:glycosyltransferase involved in cell wall biosynthesis
LKNEENLNLIIAGRIKGDQEYWDMLKEKILSDNLQSNIQQFIEFIPDSEIEIFFKASDVLVLPYKFIYQSGPLFLSYFFGLPVIASDVGSFGEDIIEGETGYTFKSEDPLELAAALNIFFESNLYRNQIETRRKIADYAQAKYSWEKIGELTSTLYENVCPIV